MKLSEIISRMPKNGWIINSSGEIRRGCTCPITSITGDAAYDYLSVADILGISRRLAKCIALAADKGTTPNDAKGLYNWRPLRDKLIRELNAVGAGPPELTP